MSPAQMRTSNSNKTREQQRAKARLVDLANRRIQPLCHLSAVCFQQLTTELPILWWLNGGLTELVGGKPPEGLSAMTTSPNFNSNCLRSPFACLNSSIRVCTFPTASSRA